MKKSKIHLLISQLVLIVTLGTNCSSDSQVLATFDGGEITRKDLRNAYLVFGYEPNPKNTTLEVQESLIETLAIQKIVRNYLEKSKEIDTSYIDRLVEITKGQLLLNYYRNDFLKKAIAKNTMEMIQLQLAILRSNQPQENDPNLTAQATELLNKLNATKDPSQIRELISANTIDINNKPTGGMSEPSCYNCGQEEFYSLFQEGIQNDHNRFYLANGNSNTYYLYRVVSFDKIHNKVLNRYLEEKLTELQKLAKEYLNTTQDELGKQAAQSIINHNPKVWAGQFSDLFSKQFREKLWKEELTRIRDSSGIKINESYRLENKPVNPKDWKEDKVLAELPNGEKVTFFQFQSVFQETNEKIYQNNPTDPTQQVYEILNFFYNYYVPALYIQWDPKSQEILNSEKYQLALEFLKNQYIFNGFIQREFSENLKIPEEDIRNTYEAGKMFAYSKEDPTNKQKRIPIPYAEVRERIRSELENQKKRSILDTKISLLKTEYNFQINKENLREGKI